MPMKNATESLSADRWQEVRVLGKIYTGRDSIFSCSQSIALRIQLNPRGFSKSEFCMDRNLPVSSPATES